MIASLTGILNAKSPEYMILDVHGVGYGIFVTLNTYYELPDLGSETTLYIYTHLREDALQLYGFLTLAEKKMFEQLIGINKVGPKLARTILSKLSVEDLKSAIIHADASKIYSVPGIGEKTAHRLILELKDKISRANLTELNYESEIKIQNKGSLFSDAISALTNLGYPKRDAEKAVRSCLSSQTCDQPNLKDLIKFSLEYLSG